MSLSIRLWWMALVCWGTLAFHTSLAVGQATINLGPDWPEMDQPSEGDQLLQRVGTSFMPREEIIKAYGRNRIAFVEIVNEGELPLRPTAIPGKSLGNDVLSRLILKAVPEAEGKFVRSRGSRFLLGPVDDFDAFCKALDFGKELERDSKQRYLKISADPQKYFLKAGGVKIEVVNADDLNKQTNEVTRSSKNRPGLDRPNMSRPGIDRPSGNRVDPEQRRKEMQQRREEMQNRRKQLQGDLAADRRQRREASWDNLDLLLKLAAENPNAASNTGYQRKNEKIEMAFVWDFDAFCKQLDFVQIVDRNDGARSITIRADLDQLTGDAVVKRAGSDTKISIFERERLGLDATEEKSGRSGLPKNKQKGTSE
jgi:hypothetical protein